MELFLACVAAFLVAGTGAPVAFVLGMEWKWRELDPAARRRIVKACWIIFLVSGGVALFVAAIAGALTRNPFVSGAAGVAVSAALFLTMRALAGQVRRVHRLSRQLEDPATREQARAEVLKSVEDAKQDSAFSSIAIAAATVLANARLYEDALAVTDRIDRGKLSGHELELWALCRLGARVQLRDVAGANAALAEVPAIAPGGAHEDVLRIARATLRVLEGEPAEALELLAAPARDPQTEKSRQIALAHAYAARGEMSRLHTCLRDIQRRGGPKELERVVRPEGPASETAKTLLEERGPYGR